MDTNRPFQFQKRSQLFIRTHDEPLSVATMRVSNPDCSPIVVNRWDAAPTPSGFAKIVRDDFPVFRPMSKVFDSNCHDVHGMFMQNGGTVTVTFNAPAAGTYYIQLKYKTNSVNHEPAPSPTTVHYEFMTTGVPGSTSGLDLVRR
jgi:hypothetical protein